MDLSTLELSLGRKQVRLVPVEKRDFYDAYDQRGKVLRYCITGGMVSDIEEAIKRDDLSDVVRLLTPCELSCWEAYRRACAGDIRPLYEILERMENLRN